MLVLPEYLESGDVGECSVCLGELDAVCGFGKAYLLVKRAVSLALDRGTDRAKEMVAVLLDALGDDHHHDALGDAEGDDDDDDDDDDDNEDEEERRHNRRGSGYDHGGRSEGETQNLGFLANDARMGGGMEKGLALLAAAVGELALDVPPSALDVDVPLFLARAHLVGTVRRPFLKRLRRALTAAKQWHLDQQQQPAAAAAAECKCRGDRRRRS